MTLIDRKCPDHLVSISLLKVTPDYNLKIYLNLILQKMISYARQFPVIHLQLALNSGSNNECMARPFNISHEGAFVLHQYDQT